MSRVRIERNVGDHGEVGQRRLDLGYAALDKSGGVRALCAVKRLTGVVYDREQGYCGDAEPSSLPEFLDEFIDAAACDTRHGGNVFDTILAVKNEDGVNQVARGQLCFGDQAAQGRRAAGSAQAGSREPGRARSTHNQSA